jgi:aspartate carbamoyltransferase regulatory subunit
MDTTNRKELKVSALENGTVIDHLPANSLFHAIRILELDKTDNQVYFGTNLSSAKYGTKGIIKVRDRFFQNHEINKISLVAPHATLIEIKDFEVVKKTQIETPKEVKDFVKCFNPKCITNHQDVPTKFKVITDKGELKLRCHYCEKTTTKDTMEFK